VDCFIKGKGKSMTFFARTLFCIALAPTLMMANQNEDMRAPRPDALSYPGSTPQIVSPFDSGELQEIQQCVCQLKSMIESGFEYVESQLDHVGSQLDILLGCASTPIYDSIVITVPGSYCLAQDITGVITIAVSGVTLWLNEWQISGNIIIGADLQNISISGGTIDPSLLADGIAIGDGCDNIRISDITVRNAPYGLNAVGVLANPITNLVISRFTGEYCAGYGIFLTECVAEVTDCLFLNNGSGIVCQGTSSRVTIADSRAQGSTGGYGFALLGGGICKCINSFAVLNHIGFYSNNPSLPINPSLLICEGCSALSGVILGSDPSVGFQSRFNCSLIAKNCIAVGNHNGFSIEGGSDIQWIDCLAKNNSIYGFFIGSISPNPAITGLIFNSTAVKNGIAGFNVQDTTLSNVRFVYNYAVDNGSGSAFFFFFQNYAIKGNSSGIGATNVATNVPPYRWYYWNNTAGAWLNRNGNN
jgi:hypothetical protein